MPVPNYLVSIYRTEKSLLTLDAVSSQKDCAVVDDSIFEVGDIVRITDNNNLEGNQIASKPGANVIRMGNDLQNTYEVTENGQVIRCDELVVDPDEVISLKATQTVGGEVAEAVVVFDNEPKKEYFSGDLIEISLGYDDALLSNIFSGEILEANQESKDEYKRLILRARNWNLLFLTDKITRSYPTPTGARQIVLDLLEDYILSHVKGQWHLNHDGADDKAIDSSICGDHDGTLVNMDVGDWVPGILNTCLSFDGSNDHVDLGNFCNFHRTEKFSVEFWFKTNEGLGPNHLIAKMEDTYPFRGWAIRTLNGKIEVVLVANFTNNKIRKWTDDTFNDNLWHHCVVTYDGSCLETGVLIYIDGILQTTSVGIDIEVTGSMQTGINLRFGTRDNNGYGYLGLLDEVIIYNTVLDQNQVSIRFKGSTGTEIPLYPVSITSCDRKITVCNVESTDQTRTVDFVGESLFDCLIKISGITVHDFYIDENKDFNWFPRNSRSFPGPPLELTNEELEDYDVTSPFELLCNKVKVYGRDNKPIPWNHDLYTDTLSDPGIWEWLLSFPARSEVVLESSNKREGNYSIKVNCTNNMNEYYEEFDSEYCHGIGAPTKCYETTIIPPSGATIILESVDIKIKQVLNDGTAYKIVVEPEGDPAILVVDSIADLGGGGVWYEYIHPPRVLANPFPATVADQRVKISWYTQSRFPPAEVCSNDYSYTYSLIGVGQTLGGILSFIHDDYKVDLRLKEAPRKLLFSLFPNLANPPPANSLTSIVIFHYEGGTSGTYRAEFQYLQNGEWTTVIIPIGANAAGWEGKVEGLIESVEIKISSAVDPVIGDYLLIDFLAFEEAKWFGEYEDSGPGSSQETHGIKFKEIFDETCFSDTSAVRIAIEFIDKFKDPIKTIKNVVADFGGQQTLKPGEMITVNLPHEGINLDYRIESITHDLTEDLDYFTNLVLSLDPVLFPGQVFQVSERVRRLEQKYNRIPATEISEVS